MRGPYKFPFIPLHCHLSDNERAIWARFVAKFPGHFDIVYFDWEVGEARPNLTKLADYVEQNRQYLGRYKIDVVGQNKEFYAVIELKKEATTKALGEIWLYDDLFRAQEKPDKPVKNYVITDVEMPNIRAVLEKEGCELFVV